MTLIGDTMKWEQTGPEQLVREVTLAEEAGFGFAAVHRPVVVACARAARAVMTTVTAIYLNSQLCTDRVL